MVYLSLAVTVLFGLIIGVLEGRYRKCGAIGGFIICLFPVIGWIMLSVIPWKGEAHDSWLES